MPSESLLFPRKRSPPVQSACHHARAINARWRSTPEQSSGHREIRVQFQHELEAATHGVARCVICLDDFVVGNVLKELPCSHCFHSVCIAKWLAERSTCPVCQQYTNGAQQWPRCGAPKSKWPLL